MPGGNKEPGESLEDAIRRELMEETSLDIPDLERFTVVESTAPDGKTKGHIQVFRGRWNGDAAALAAHRGRDVPLVPGAHDAASADVPLDGNRHQPGPGPSSRLISRPTARGS